jgi:hypothetical protein
MTSPDSLEIHRHGRETAVERLDGASVRVLFGGYLLFRKNVGQVALDVRPIDGSPGSGKSVACGACSVSASDFVAVAEARSIRVLDSALNETHAVVSFDENILNVIAFPSLSREAFLVTTISGDVYRVEIGPPAIKSPAWRSD